MIESISAENFKKSISLVKNKNLFLIVFFTLKTPVTSYYSIDTESLPLVYIQPKYI
jgi:hypothetical protein